MTHENADDVETLLEQQMSRNARIDTSAHG
jgi:hypothetical protein